MEIQAMASPARGGEVSFAIPEVLAKEFAKDLRVVIRHPWIVGIPVPERLCPEVFKNRDDFEILITPYQATRALNVETVVPFQGEMSFRIPEVYAKEFARDLRVVIRHPWIVGIPIPERLRVDVLKGLKELEVIAVPR